jgi:acetyl esterase/lipase
VVSWIIVIASVLVGFAVIVSYVPPRIDAFGPQAFTIGWLTGELAVQWAVLVALGDVLVALTHVAHGWQRTVSLSVLSLAAVGLLGLHLVARRSLGVVRAGLLAASEEAIVVTSDHAKARYGHVFQRVLALPVGRRSVAVTKNVPYLDDGLRHHRLDVYCSRTEHPGPRPVLLYIHGGAWVIGDKREQARPMLYELAARGWLCLSINYRLSPKATWPDHVVDCKAAIAWAKREVGAFGGDPSHIVVAGGSAGGHLASLCALTPNDPAFQAGFEDADTAVAGCISFYGVLEMTGDATSSGVHGQAMMKMLEKTVMKKTQREHADVFEAASPLHRITEHAPPFLVFQGTNDTLVPVEVARQFVERFRSVANSQVAYVELPLAQHAFDIFASPRCTATTAGVVAFLEQLEKR